MMSIIAHHIVVNTAISYNLLPEIHDARNVYLWVFGMWGKVGINCFVLITGWYMCTSAITLKNSLNYYLKYIFISFSTLFFYLQQE